MIGEGKAGEAWLLVGPPRRPKPARNVFWLNEKGRLEGAARRLFAVLRQIDAMGFKVIHAELARGGGMAEAINDRLRRAAARMERNA